MVPRHYLWVSRIRGCTGNGCLSARKPRTFCRRFVPRKLRLMRKREQAPALQICGADLSPLDKDRILTHKKCRGTIIILFSMPGEKAASTKVRCAWMGGGAETICAKAARGYVRNMDWQKIAALAVVAGTAGVFLTRAWPRRRKFSFERGTHCGCGTAGYGGAKNSVVFHARKGERARVIVKMR